MRSMVVPAASLALAGLLAACSSSSSATANPPATAQIGSPPATSAPATTAGSPTSPASASSPAAPAGNASAQIKTNWEAFFSGKTSGAQKVALLQNGQRFAQTIDAQAGSSLSQSAGAQVTSVVVNGTSADVTYNITLAGKSALPGQKGTAVFEGGTWKVGDASFCSLLTLENSGTPPAVCKSVGG